MVCIIDYPMSALNRNQQEGFDVVSFPDPPPHTPSGNETRFDVDCGSFMCNIGTWMQLSGTVCKCAGFQHFLPARARAARERLVLRLLYVFRVCLSVCASALITCAICYRSILRLTTIESIAVPGEAAVGLMDGLKQQRRWQVKFILL